MPDVSIVLESTIPWSTHSPYEYNPTLVVPNELTAGTDKGNAEMTNFNAPLTIPYINGVGTSGVTIPTSADVTPYEFNFGFGNSNADDPHIFLIWCEADITVEFFTSGDVSLGSIDVDGGDANTYAWLNENTSPAWFSDGSGDCAYVQVTLRESITSAAAFKLDVCSDTAANTNTLMTNLRYYWKLEETSGNFEDTVTKPDATTELVRSGTCTSSTGKSGNGVDTSGNSNADYIYANNYNTIKGGLPGLNGSRSLSFWAKIDGVSGNLFDHQMGLDILTLEQCWAKIYHTGSQFIFEFRTPDGFGGMTTGTINLTTLPTTADNLWYNIVLLNGATGGISVYVNSVLQGTTTNTLDIANSGGTEHLRFGENSECEFDEIVVWNEALSAAAGDDIDDLYNGGTGLFYDSFSI